MFQVIFFFEDFAASLEINHDFIERTEREITFQLADPCPNGIDGYEFDILLESNYYTTVVSTNQDGSFTGALPPYTFTASVIDVNKRDAFSATLLDFF